MAKKDRFIKNVTDQVKEAQLKLGYARETVRLYFPEASMQSLLETKKQGEELLEEARGLVTESDFPGGLAFRSAGGRVEVTVSPEGAEYVHRQVETPAFLAELIALFQENHHCSLEEICRVFGRYSEDYTCERMAEDSDFDYVIFFQDPSIDEYFYCIKAEMGHTIYHRFTRADYLAL